MKKILLSLLAAVAVTLASCSDKNAEKLIQTVPVNTKMLNIVNTEKLASELNEQGKKTIEQFLQKQKAEGNNKLAAYLLGENSPLDPSVPFIVFEYKNGLIATFMTRSGSTFREDIEKELSTSFSKENGIWKTPDNTIFVNGDQAWIAPHYPEITSSDIKKMSEMTKVGSMLSLDCVGEMLENDADISSLLNLAGLTQASFGNAQSALILNTLFASPKYLYTCINFEKGKAVGETTVLNDKGKPAAMSIKPKKIDLDALKKFEARGNIFFATALDSQVIGNLTAKFKNLAPMNAGIFNLIEQIDGDILVVINSEKTSELPGSMAGMVTFKDAESARKCVELLSEGGELAESGVTIMAEDKYLFASIGVQTGKTISEVSKNFEGTGLGLVILAPEGAGKETSPFDLASSIIVKLDDIGDSAKLNFTINTKPGQNSLNSLIELLTYLSK